MSASQARPISITIHVQAPLDATWDALTSLEAMRAWMGEPEMDVRVTTDWSVGSSFHIAAFHHAPIESRGQVLRFEPERALAYSTLASISRLPDVPSSYTRTEIELSAEGDGTEVTVSLSGFPTEAIEKHQAFYWRGTLVIFKRFVEERLAH